MSNEDQVDRIFKALANKVRREICDALRLRPLTTKQLSESFDALDRTTVMMHLRVLEDAGLVVPVRKGRERFNHLDAMPIHHIHERWIGPHAAQAVQGLARLKRDLETVEDKEKQSAD